jgi:hypothetical protein
MSRLFSCMALAALLFFIDATAFAFRCNDRIVSEGDTKAEVIMKCGEPQAKDARTEEVLTKSDVRRKRKTTISIDEWTYNFGPSSFIRVLTFTNGKLTDIKETTYGVAEQGSSGRCDEQPPSIGDTKGEVLVKCGEPFWKDAREEKTTEKINGNRKKKKIIALDEWTYNFGPNKFIRIYQFKNGRLVDISTGGYGK